MSPEDQRIGRNVVRLRGRMSQVDVAQAMRARGHKWAQNTVSAVESGDRPLRLTESRDLVEILVGVSTSPSELLESETSADVRNSVAQVALALSRFKEATDHLRWAFKEVRERIDDGDVLDPIDKAALQEALDRIPSRIELDFNR